MNFDGLVTDEGPAMIPVGTLEVAYHPERLRELWRRHDVARSWGWRGRMLEPDDAVDRWPILRRDGLLGAYATDGEGLAASRRAVQAQAERAQMHGARFRGDTEVTGFETADGRVTGVVTDGGTIPADVIAVCAGVWGPLAREVVQPLTGDDLSDAAFPYLTCRGARIGGVEVEAARISYAGELGWELSCAAEDGRRLWDAVWPAARDAGMVAAGRAALGSLRIEKGYRAWGADLTPEHAPDGSGLAFTVRRDGSDFLGHDGLAARPPSRHRLRCLVLGGTQPVMGGEPVLVDDEVVGDVTSASWGPSVGESIAYAWVDAALDEGAEVDVLYFDRAITGCIAAEPRFDQAGVRLRS